MTATEVREPEKELRFTRAGQARLFWVLSAMLAGVAFTMAATAVYREINPELPHAAWALLPFAASVALARLALRLTRHAYLILTPLGIEVFPFYRPASGMNVIFWQEIHSAEVAPDRRLLTLHRDAGKTSGVRLTLLPIRPDRRELLAKAVLGRLGERTA